jgi:hypothetical protein
MTISRRLVALLGAVFISAAAFADDASKTVPIFDGRTLAGWEGNTNVFRVVDGAIVGGNRDKRLPHHEFLCTTRSYTNFVLRLQFKLHGDRPNSGIQIRSQRKPDHYEVIGYQADLGDPGWWGSLYDESRRNRLLAQSDMEELNKVLKRDDWNEYVIRCEAKRIQLWINGRQTVDYTEPDDSIPQHGIIGLQVHSGSPCEAWFKDITIEELP